MGKLKGKGAVITGRRQQALDEAVKVIGRNVTSVRGVAVFFGWMVINIVPGPSHFDPPPFTLLDTIGALESILLASFILMRQSGLAKRVDERDHLMLQILLLSEREVCRA